MIRTDMAWENEELLRQNAQNSSEQSGIRTRQTRCRGLGLKIVEILNEEGQRAIGKPIGTFYTLDVDASAPKPPAESENIARALAEVLAPLLDGTEQLLTVGLGNEAITPDSIGPRSLKNVIVTRHLRTLLGENGALFRSVCAAEPGVLGATGLESAEIVQALVREVSADAVVAIDALATADPCRICRSRETMLAEGVNGLYPMGEGAGYAGGIMSAAVDGMKAALSFLNCKI